MLKSFRFWCCCAAAVSLGTAALHVWGGGPEFHEPALATALPDRWKAAFSTIWHEVTALFLINGLFLVAAGFSTQRESASLRLIFALNFAFALLFVTYGATRLGTLFALPQWIIAATICACIGIALWTPDKHTGKAGPSST